MPEPISERGGITGTIIVRSHPAGTIDKYHALAKEGKLFEAQALIAAGEVKVRQKNMIVWSLNCGFDILVQYLLSAYFGSLSLPLGIAWAEIGTGNTAPANTDTALTTPTNRAPVSFAADSAYDEAQLQFFFPDGVLSNTTYYEAGCFVGGSSSIGSGNLFNHGLFATPYSKSAGTDTTLQINFSFSNS
jgi:hypothetical protein